MNALFCGVNNEEFKKISSMEVAKEAWTILETIHEGTNVVKIVKFQRLTSSFEEIRMEEDETFDEIFTKLKDIVNSAFKLGESITESKIVKQILRSLLERFHAKITAIEEVKDIDQIPLTELLGNLQTYEMGLGLMGKGEKSKNWAIKGIEEEIGDFEDEDESKDEDEDDDEDEDEDLIFIADEIIKLLQFRQKDMDKSLRKSKSSKKGKNEKPFIQCYECKGFGHMRIEYPNYLMKEKTKKSKDKGLVATWSDTKDDSFDEYVDECGHFMAFAAITDKVIVENASDNENSSDDEVPKKMTLQEAYDKLCTEFIKSKNTSHLCRKELNEVKTEKVDLLVKVNETTRLVETLVVENTSLEKKIKNLEVELSQVRTQIERMFSVKLDEVLSTQKPSSDKTGLDYAVSSGPSSTVSRSKTIFVLQSEKSDKGMKSKTNLTISKSFIRPHVCHHCGVSGHIRPNCFKLYPHKHLSKRSQVSSQGPTLLFGELLKALSFLTQFQENLNSSMSFSRHTRTHAFSFSRPKTCAVWVRKEPKT